MKPRDLIEFLAIVEKLKCVTRHSWTSTNRHESVAEHSYRLSFMILLVADQFPDLDVLKALKMSILHDLGEAVTGDIPAFYKNESDRTVESEALNQMISQLPEPLFREFTSLLQEYDDQLSLEAKLVKALDKIECLISHNEASIDTWLPLEYTLNLTYGEKEVDFHPYLKELKELVKSDSIDKLRNSGKE